MEDWKEYVTRLRAGEPGACTQFWGEFGDAMKRLSDRNISPNMQQRVDAEDVVQSVCRTFFRRANEGEFLLEDSNSLWRLLCAITVAKTRRHIRFHRSQKRDVNAEQRQSASSDVATDSNLPEKGERPEQQAEFADQLDHIFAQLDEEERRIVEARLQGLDNFAIAEQLECSERTVRRILNRIETRLHDDIAEMLAS